MSVMWQPRTQRVLRQSLYRSTLIAAILLFAMSGQAGERRENQQTGLWIYSNEQEGFSIELIQLHGEFVRAVFGSKGFTPEMLEHLDEYCFYGTVVRNTSGRAVGMKVRDWFTRTADGQNQPLKTKTDWIEDWAKAGVPFKWLMLGDDVTFAPDDWLQGFSSVKLPRGSHFDLHYSWILEGKRREAILDDIECPPYTLPES